LAFRGFVSYQARWHGGGNRFYANLRDVRHLIPVWISKQRDLFDSEKKDVPRHQGQFVGVLENETAVRCGEAPEIDGTGVATPFNIRE